MPAFPPLHGPLRFSKPKAPRQTAPPLIWSTALAVLTVVIAIAPLKAAVYLEDSPDAAQRARQAQDHLEAGRAGEAATLLQEVRTAFGNRLMERTPGIYMDATRWVNYRLYEDPTLRTAYRERFDDEAQRARGLAHNALDPQEALAAVAARYAGSGPGRDAALDLAAQHVRAGRGVEARVILDDLANLRELAGQALGTPLESGPAARYWTLRAWTAALCSDPSGRERALGQLSPIVGPGPTQRLRAQLRPPTPAVEHPDAAGPQPESPGPAPRPLWSVTLALPEPSPPPHGQVARRGSQVPELRAVAHDDLILANDTQRVYAMDAVSGRLRWSHALAEPDTPADSEAVWRGGAGRQELPAPRAVAADGRYAFAVLGNAQTLQGRRGPGAQPPNSAVVALSTEHGGAQWTAHPADVDAVVARASFHGTPLLTPDLVIVAARRSQASSFQDSYLVAFDRANGEVRWRRHLASTQAIQNRTGGRGGRPLSTLTLDSQRGRIYFCDNLGAAAALDASTGAVRWLRVFELANEHAATHRAGFGPLAPEAAPTAVRGGVLLPVVHGNAHGLLLDPDTGHTIQALTDPSLLGGLTHLLPLPGGDVLAAVSGGTVRRINGDDLTATWSRSGGGAGLAVAGSQLWLLDDTHRLTRIEPKSGATAQTTTLTLPGSLLPVEHGVVTVLGRSFASYTPWSTAYTTLQERAARHPKAPEIGLSMATLALNAAASGSTEAGAPSTTARAVRAGLDHVLLTLSATGLTSPSPGQDRSATFDTLLALTERASAVLPRDEVNRIFDRLAGSARSATELLGYTLARAAWAERDQRPTRAADLYQTVLDNDALASGLVRRQGVIRRGGIVARQLLQELIAHAGPQVYAAHTRRAAQALAELGPAAQHRNPAVYLTLAHRYPLAAATAEALLRAGQLQSAGPTPAAAATTLRRSYQLAVDNPTRSAAAVSLTNHYLAHNRPAAAARWLTQVDRDHPKLRLDPPDGPPRLPGEWATALSARSTTVNTPPLRLPLGAPVSQPGRLLAPPGPPPTGTRAPGHVLLRGPGINTLALYRLAAPAQPHWVVDDNARDSTLIDLDTDTAVLWSAAARQITVRAVADGQALFPAVSPQTLLAELGAGGSIAAARRLTAGASIQTIEADFGRPLAETRQNQMRLQASRTAPAQVAAGEAAVAVVDAVGRAAAFDRYTGKALWHLELPLDAVHWSRAAQGLLLIGGLRGAGTGAESGVVLVLDLTTGRPHLPTIEDTAAPQWAGIGHRGDVVVIHASGELTAHDAPTGAVRWRVAFPPLQTPIQAYATGSTLTAADPARLLMVDLERGAVTGEVSKNLNRTRLLHAGPRRLLIHDESGVTALDRNGHTAWRSAAALATPGPISVAATDGAILLAVRTHAPQPTGVTFFRLDPATGRITHRQHQALPDSPAGATQLTARHQALLLTDPHQRTLIFPAADAP